ncbi:MAG: tetratricopeptide repeat protein [Alphaproteobacteria bacterium]
MEKISRLLKVLPAGICAVSLAACGKSQNQQTYIVSEDAPKIDVKNLDAGSTSLRLADSAYAKGEYSMAAQLYYRAAELQPDKTDVMIKLGFALFKAGGPADAEKVFRAALQQNPKHLEALRGLAHSLVIQGRAAEAVNFYRQAMADGGKGDVRVYAGLGAALDMVGKHDEARSTYQAGLKLAPEDFGIRNNMALSYAMSGEGEKAKAILNGLSQNNPGMATKTNHSLSMVNSMTLAAAKTRPAAKPREVAEFKPAAKPAADDTATRIDTHDSPELRDVAEVPAPARRAAMTRKATADLAVSDTGDGTIYINTGRASVVRAESSSKPEFSAAMSFRSDADTPEDAAAEVLDLLQQAERGPRFVWQEARRPDRS